MIRRNSEASGSRNGGRERTLARGKQSHENKDVNMADNDGEDDVTSGTKLDLSKKELPAKDGLIEAFSRLKQLQRLDMSEMQPSIENENPNGLDNLAWLGKAVSKSKRGGKSGTPYFGQKLTWLKFSDNSSLGKYAGEKAWDGLEQFSSLTVLNASSCDLPIAPPSFTLMAWQSLGALVLGHNSIKSLPHFPSMPQLNTIVLSHNQITSLPKDLPANLPGLKKLSITHNLLQWTNDQSPLPDFSICSHLREVRISGNSQLTRLPNHMSGWGKGVGKESKGTGLETFEAGDCGLDDWNSISALLMVDNSSVEAGDGIHPSRLRRLRGLTTLSLRGNDVIKQTDYREKILQAHPALRVLDSVRLKDESKMQEEFKATIEKLAAPPRPEKTSHSRSRDPGNHVEPNNTDVRKKRELQSGPNDVERPNRLTAKDKVVRRPRNDEQRNESVRKENSQNKQFSSKKNQRSPVEDQMTKNEAVVSEEVTTKKPHKRGGRGKSKGNKKKEDNDAEDSLKDPFLQSAGKSKAGKEEDEEERMARIRARAGPSVEASSKPSKKSNSNSEKLSSETNKSPKKGNKVIAEASKEETSSKPKKRKAEEVNKSHAEESIKKTKVEAREKAKLRQPEEGEKKEDISSVARVVNVSKAKSKNVEKKPNTAFEFTKKKQSISNGLQLGSGGAWN